MARTLLSDWIDRLRAAERSGDLLVAYDLASQGLEQHPESVQLRYLATRVLARSGATDQAAAHYKSFRLDRERDTDIASLGARIAKDYALAASSDRRRALRSAAAAYAEIYARTRQYYPAINAATLYLLAGNRDRAEAFAAHALDAGHRGADRTPLDRYYRWATRAEAALIRRDAEGARQALRKAVAHLGGNFDAAATTRKQLRLVCRATKTPLDILDVIRPPAVLHYSGPILVAPGLADRGQERALVGAMVDYLGQREIGFAYGSLAAGSEILCAEACLRAGAELHVILPFNKDEFVARMVRPAGAEWLRRFNSCLRGAKLVTFATADSYREDNDLFSYTCRLGMGMAILRAQHLDTAASHVRLRTGGWDPDPRGYATNLKLWHALGRSSDVLGPEGDAPLVRPTKKPRRRAHHHQTLPRSSRALLFGDVRGFSRTPDHLIPVFLRRLMGAIATVLKRYERHLLYRNSWGDAIYAVIDDPVVAAECCLAIQEAIAKARPTRYGLSSELALRLAAHFGPVYDGHDPIRDERMFFGAHTVLAARIEPVTAPGQVYVTEAMAAAIAMADVTRFRAEYVGNVPMAKGFGMARMYALKSVGPKRN